MDGALRIAPRAGGVQAPSTARFYALQNNVLIINRFVKCSGLPSIYLADLVLRFCILPRVSFSELDAHYCSHYIKLMHKINIATFPTLQIISLVCEKIIFLDSIYKFEHNIILIYVSVRAAPGHDAVVDDRVGDQLRRLAGVRHARNA